MKYNPSIFTCVTSLDAAKRIILTNEVVLNTDQRWEKETPHICDLIDQHIKLDNNSLILDYGCGVGRIAKELIKRHGCWVVGVDISSNMLALAASYVDSERFIACHPQALPLLELNFDLALAIWVLQHVNDIERNLFMMSAMLTNGYLFVVNEGTGRFIPTDNGWVSDGADVRAVLNEKLKLINDGHMSADVVGTEQSERTFWALYKT